MTRKATKHCLIQACHPHPTPRPHPTPPLQVDIEDYEIGVDTDALPRVVCRQLGFAGGLQQYFEAVPPLNRTELAGNLVCRGDEPSVQRCSFSSGGQPSGWGAHPGYVSRLAPAGGPLGSAAPKTERPPPARAERPLRSLPPPRSVCAQSWVVQANLVRGPWPRVLRSGRGVRR